MCVRWLHPHWPSLRRDHIQALQLFSCPLPVSEDSVLSMPVGCWTKKGFVFYCSWLNRSEDHSWISVPSQIPRWNGFISHQRTTGHLANYLDHLFHQVFHSVAITLLVFALCYFIPMAQCTQARLKKFPFKGIQPLFICFSSYFDG